MNIGERLKQARKYKSFTQDELADKLGVSRGVITNIERGITDPQPLVVNAICNAMEINKDWLLTGKGEMSLNTETLKSAKILSEIYSAAKELSEEEQTYILKMIRTFEDFKTKKDDS